MRSTLTYKTKNYFTNVVYMLGWFFGLLTLTVWVIYWWLTPVFGFLTVLIFTARYEIVIDPSSRKIEEYLMIIGMKTQKEAFNYARLEHIYLTKSRYSQQMSMRAAASTAYGEIYKAYLKSDAGSHYLGESKELIRLQKRLKPISEALKLEIKKPA